MFDFDSMAKNLQNNINMGARPNYSDDRYWKITKDEHGKGAAIIRLIPDKNLVPFIKMFHYSLNRPNPANPAKKLWYINKSPDTIGLPDPVKEHYMKLIEEKTEEAKAEAKRFSRQTKFIANIIVIKDPANPENNGKVFLWEFGTKLLDKFNSWVHPSEQELAMDQKPMNIFHPVDGFNITLKIRPDQHSFTYDDTTIIPNSCSIHKSVVDEDSAFKFIQANTYELNEMLKPESFDSYETLKSKFEKFLGNSVGTPTSRPSASTQRAQQEDDDEMPDWMDSNKNKQTTENAQQTQPRVATTSATTAVTEEDDDWLDKL